VADQKLTIQISVDAQQAQSTLKTVDSQVDQIGDTAKSSVSQVEQAFGKATTSIIGTSQSAVDLNKSIMAAFTSPLDSLKTFGTTFATNVTENLGAAGAAIGVVTGLFAGLATVVLVNAEHFAHLGAALDDQSQKTGIAIPALSQLSNAIKIAGGNVDQLSNAMFMFSERTSISSDTVADGLKKIGLSFTDIMRMSPDQQLLAIAHGLAQTADASERNGAGFEIFGRQARDLMPMLVDLDKSMELAGSVNLFTADDAQRAKDYEMQVETLKLQFQDLGLYLGKTFLPFLQTGVNFARGSLGWLVTDSPFAQGIVGGAAALQNLNDIGKGIDELSKPLQFPNAPAAPKDLTADIDAQAEAMAKAAAEADHYSIILEQWAKSQQKVKDEVEKVEESYATGAMNWVDKLSTLRNNADLDRVKSTNDSIDKIEKIEGEYATGAMAAMSKISDFRDKGDIDYAKKTAESLEKANQLWDQYYKVIGDDGATTLQKQVNDVNVWYQEQLDKAQAAGIVNQQYYDALAAVAHAKLTAVIHEHDLVFQSVKQTQEYLSEGWQKTFADTLVATGDFGKSFKSIWDGLVKDLENIGASMLSAVVKGFLQPLLDAVSGVTSSITKSLVGALSGGAGDAAGGIGGALGGAGSGIGGALAGAGSAIGGGIAGLAGFLATNPVGWAIDAGLGLTFLFKKLFGGPSEEELAGRQVYAAYKQQVWATLSGDQQKEAQGAGWSDPMDAGFLIGMRDYYASIGRPDPEKSAEAYMNNAWDAITKGRSGETSALQDIQSFARGGVVLPFRGTDTVPAMLSPGEGIVSRGAMASLGAGGLAALNRGGGLGLNMGGVTVNVMQGMSDAEAEDLIGKTIVKAMRRRGVKFSGRAA
jgi:hypothetical protein